MSELLPTQSQNPHPVLDEIQRRVNGESPQMRLALSIEGGGMRSVVSTSMASALLDYGIRAEHFDAVFGVSGGSFNAAYYVAGQSAECTAGYWEDTGKKLIDFSRFFHDDRPPVDMDHMLHGMVHSKPLDFDTVVGAQKVRPLATDITTGRVHVFEPAQTREELLLQLKAGSAVPIIGSGSVDIEGHQYMDAAIVERIPFETPFQLGYDAVLVLATKALETVPPSRLAQTRHKQLKRIVRRLSPEFAELALEDPQEKFQRARRLQEMTDSPSEPPFAYVISPGHDDTAVGRFELETSLVITGAKVGYAAVDNALRQHALIV